MNTLKTYSQIKKIDLCVRFNLFVILVCILFFLFSVEPGHIKIGPSDDFEVLGIKIDTPLKYGSLFVLIFLIVTALLITEEFAMPTIEFTTYNPQCAVVDEFTRWGLQLRSNTISMTKEALKLFKIVILVSRLDALVFVFLVEELMAIVTVYVLLEDKTFPADQYPVARTPSDECCF